MIINPNFHFSGIHNTVDIFSALPPVLFIKNFQESFNLPRGYPLSIVLSMKTVAMHMGDIYTI